MTDLPPVSKDVIVDVSLKHVIAAALTIAGGTFVVAAGISAVKDYVRYKRQKALLESAMQVLLIIKNGGTLELCSEQKMDLLSPTTMSGMSKI